MSTSVLKALPGKLDIKRHSPCILYISFSYTYVLIMSLIYLNYALDKESLALYFQQRIPNKNGMLRIMFADTEGIQTTRTVRLINISKMSNMLNSRF